MHRRLLLPLFFLLPLAVSADAGFARGSLWLSSSSVTAGDTVVLYAALSNQTPSAVSGTVSFADGESSIGSVQSSLAAGESRVVSVSWKAEAGSHSLRAVFTDTQGEMIDEVGTSVAVAEKISTAPQSASTQTASVSDSTGIQQTIADVSPAVGGVVNPALETADSWREQGVVYLDKKIADSEATLDALAAQKKALGGGSVLGESNATPEVEKESRSIAIKQVLHTILVYLMEVLRFILASSAIFYPLLVILFFYALYRIYRRFRRPRYADI